MYKIITILIFLIAPITFAKSENLNTAGAYWGVHYYDYIERTTTKDPFMTLKTAIPTVTIGLRDETAIRGDTDNKFSYYTEFSIGEVTYAQHTGTGGHDHTYWVWQSEAFYALPANFYTGLGYRHLKDYLSQGGSGGYDRQNQMIYLPIGYIFSGEGTLKLQYNILLEGTQFSQLSQIPGYGDLTNTQNEGYGMEFAYTAPSGGWEVFTKYWNIDDSTLNSSTGTKWIINGMEPMNETLEIGVKVAF
ncbi:hypothetical protein N8925_01925 [Candidatus Pelagibacter sp.]|jgi:hypothetical protein|nr:hypothetical protein [Candidatus Pelagibacter sp.]